MCWEKHNARRPADPRAAGRTSNASSMAPRVAGATPTQNVGPYSNASSMALRVVGAMPTNAAGPASYANILADPLVAFPPISAAFSPLHLASPPLRPVGLPPRAPVSAVDPPATTVAPPAPPPPPPPPPTPSHNQSDLYSATIIFSLGMTTLYQMLEAAIPLVFPRLIAKSRVPG